jgi:hypothetical protein
MSFKEGDVLPLPPVDESTGSVHGSPLKRAELQVLAVFRRLPCHEPGILIPGGAGFEDLLEIPYEPKEIGK